MQGRKIMLWLVVVALQQTAATGTGDADAMDPQRGPLHKPMHDLLHNDPHMRAIIAGFDGPSSPHWVARPESHEERTAHLLRRVDTKSRRLQDDGNLAAAVLNGDDGTTIGCTDPLASNDGALEASCTYSCAALEQEYFPGQPARCFVYDPSTQTWPAELLAMRQHHNTIVIPNNENWIIQGNVDPATGLQVSLDARLSSGTPLDRSHANIVLRYVRFTEQLAPVEISPELVGYGTWWAAGSYGGAFRYEGGSSDHANPVRLVFDHVIYDHNRATVGGAMFINGRAGAAVDGTSTQNWESGIAATWDSCMFYRNFAESTASALMAPNVWPMTFSWNNCAFIENSVDLGGVLGCC